MTPEMTDTELSERVCKALGIEPLEWQVIDGCGDVLAHHHRKKDIDEWLSHNRNDPEFASYRKRSVYPYILDWAGFGRVVERLRERNMPFTMQHFTDPYPNCYGVRVNYMKTCHADTLPRALALAVLEWEASRGSVE